MKIEPEALFLLALLYYLDDSGIAVRALAACTLHELGHWGMICAVGGEVRELRLSGRGAELRLSTVRTLSSLKMALSALAGPAMNLLLAGISTLLARNGGGGEWYFFAALNLGLAGFNLLPVSWLDGGRVLQCLFSCFGLEMVGQNLLNVCSRIIILLLLFAGGALFLQSEGRSFTLLIAGLWMALVTGRGERG